MKTKLSHAMASSSSSAKSHSKKSKDSGRDRDKIKASESGGSSQCDTPPLVDKDVGAQGKFAGIGPDSVLCMAEQSGIDMNQESATNLAEDISYKLRQMISTIALHSELMKKSRVDSWDVNTAFTLADTSHSLGTVSTHYTIVGEEKLFTPVEELINVRDLALSSQTYVYSSPPSLSVEWITDEKSRNHNSSQSSNISVHLQNYYTKVARAILNLRKKPKDVAVEDLMTNTRIGPIFPNLFNLAVLVLNDDNLNALNVPTKKPLQSNVLDMVDALCSNPCSLDTNIQQQFQRLFPVMVSNILGNGSLSEKMVTILTKITRTWPPFITIGKGILFEYLSQGTKDRLTGPMIRCVMALGRRALVECLGEHLDHLDGCLLAPRRTHQNDLRETLLDVSTHLLRSEPTTFLEDFVITDYTLYEMLGDSIMPRRTIFPRNEQSLPEDDMSSEGLFIHRSYLRRPKIRLLPSTPPIRNGVHNETIFEPTRFSSDMCIRIKIKNCRTLHVPRRHQSVVTPTSHMKAVVVASGLLHRFKYKLNKPNPAPVFGALML